MMKNLRLRVVFIFFILLINLCFFQTHAQDSTSSVKKAKLKTFGGAVQYSRWSVGLAAGALAPVDGLGGKNQYAKYNLDFGYSAFVKYQIQHSFGIRADYLGGQFTAINGVSGQNPNFVSGANSGTQINSKLTYALSIKGEVDVAAMDFLRRQNAVRVFLTAGYGLAGYKPDLYGGNTVKAGFVPFGAGVKIKASKALAINLGYDIYFFDASNLFGTPNANGHIQNKGSYGSVGLEYTFGTATKPAMVWVNPIALTYDEIKANDSLAKEVDGLKSRVSSVEGDVSKLKKDSDGDGVSDVFDKCPNTPVGTRVDGAGCELPKPTIIIPDTTAPAKASLDSKLQFDFNSAKIKPFSYPLLDDWAKRIDEKSADKMTLEGYASSEGNRKYNLVLSRKRAEAVKKYWINKGVPSSKIKAVGKGITNPIAPNTTEEGREKNRRVEFIYQMN